jgi:beta-glucosidase
LSPKSTTLNKDGEVNIQFNVKNTGTRDGAEVVQLYVSFPGSSKHHNINRKLVGFERVELKAGEEKTVTIPLKHEQLSYYDDETHNFKVEGAQVNFYVSASSADDRLSGTINAQEATIKETYISDPSIVTGIQQPAVTTKHMQGEKVFNLQGTYVGTTEQMTHLPKGMYIIGGKKYIAK